MVKLNSKIVNWVKKLPRYATVLNEGAREGLGWKNPFKIYYGRKSNAIFNEQTESLGHNETQVTKPKISWFSIEDIADFHSGEKRKGNDFNNEEKELKRKKMDYMRLLLSPMTMDDRMHLLTEQGYSMTFNPSKDGNCQFSAIAHALSEYGIFRSPTTLRYEVVEYLRNNSHNAEGFPFDVFLTQPWEDYLQEMSHHGTYGDQITLQTVADMLGVEILVISTLGSEGRVWISPRSAIPLCRVILGHFSEGEGIHYVAMRPQSGIFYF